MANSYRELSVWQKSYTLTKDVYPFANNIAAELSTQLLLAQDIYKLDRQRLLQELEDIQKIICGLIKNCKLPAVSCKL